MPLEIIHGQTLNDAGALTRVTMFGEDSNTIRAYPDNSACWLLGTWNQVFDTGEFSIRAPAMHDNVNGIQGLANSSEVLRYLFPGKMQFMRKQMNTNIFLSGNSGAAQYSVIALLLWYDNLPESKGNYAGFDDVLRRTRQIMSLKHNLTPATETNYTAGEVVVTNQNQFKAGTKYAFLGFKALGNGEVVSLNIRGHDTGNLRIGQPAGFASHYSEPFFYPRLAKFTGLNCIPIFNSENVDNIFIDLAANVATSELNFWSYWAELS